jgi:5'-nucleotidase
MILVSNDDGIYSPNLWALAGALSHIEAVVVVAPDREQSAIGTALTLRQPLRVQPISSLVPGIEAQAVDGTPGDSVILAVGKLYPQIGMVVSGINSGYNMGDDILISGTVGAALQGYLRNLPAIAVSMSYTDTDNRVHAANLVGLLAGDILAGRLPGDMFLNINYPELPLDKIKGIRVTQPAHKTHIDGVSEGNDGRRQYFWLVRRQLEKAVSAGTDLEAVEKGFISLTFLNHTMFRRPPAGISPEFCQDLFTRLRALG